MNSYFFAMRRKKEIRRFLKRAGVERIELPSAVLETDVLPLYDTPKNKKMVTCTGFEPVSAAVKGRCVKPLHQHATLLPNWCLNIILKGLSNCKTFFLCGRKIFVLPNSKLHSAIYVSDCRMEFLCWTIYDRLFA